MLSKVAAVWVAGLFSIVPYGTYYLLFHAQRDEYALLVTLILFWIFGFWGVAGPLIAAIKLRRIMQAMERAKSREELIAAFRHEDTRSVAIDLIASENRIPRFLAARICGLVVNRLSSASRPPENPN